MSLVSLTAEGDMARVVLDDGKVNALTREGLAELAAALDDCAGAAAVLVQGRDGYLSAGLDTRAFATLGPRDLAEYLTTWARLLMRLWLEPVPTVLAATGHALAAGTMLALACDHVVAAEGDYRWGLNETRMGFAVPQYALALANGRVPAPLHPRLLLGGAVVEPTEALAAGYAHELRSLAQVRDTARERAADLATIAATAYGETKRRLREASARAVLEGLTDDIDVVLQRGGDEA